MSVRSIAIVVLLGLVPVAGGDTPQVADPGLVPRSWELKFEFHDPQRIAITHPGDATATTYWYMLYTVTNLTDQEVDYFPAFHLVTDSLHVTIGGEQISTSVFEAVRARHYKQYPFLVDPSRVSGRLLQGVDNARQSVAIFRQFDLESNGFTVFVAGLSGQIERIPNARFDPSQPESLENTPFFYLRKTLSIRYTLPGDLATREQAQPTRVGREWVMR